MDGESPRRILVILMGSLGDVARGLAVVTPLKRAFPLASVSWLVEPKCEALVRLHPGIDKVIVFQRKKGLFGIPALARELRAGEYDLVLDMQRHFKSGLFSRLSRAPRRIGFNRKNAKELNWLFNNEKIDAASDELAKLDHYLMFVRHLGIDPQRPLDFGLNGVRQLDDAKKLLSGLKKPFCVLVLGSSWDSKDWPPAGYRQLIQSLLRIDRLNVLLVGDRTQAETAEKLSGAVQDGRVVSLAAKTSIAQLVALIDEALFCAGPDSGPGHISGAVGTPYISLFGPTSPSRTAPCGSEHLVVSSRLACMPCYRRVCPGLDKLCMRTISSEAVMERVNEVLESIR